MKPAPTPATPVQTRAELLRVSGSGYVKVRHDLCQLPQGEDPRFGVIRAMVSQRKRRSLQLYLLLLTAWPWLRNQERPLASSVWARALTTTKGRRWSPTDVSRAWADLEERGLITRKRVARGVWIEPRREDGTADYEAPAGAADDPHDWYFVIPAEFWTQEWFEELSLPGLAMFLILLSRTNDTAEQWFTYDVIAQWYGLSRRSVATAMAELQDHGLVSVREEWAPTPLSGIGYTQKFHYSLTGPFSTDARARMRAQAATDRETRVKKKSKKASP